MADTPFTLLHRPLRTLLGDFDTGVTPVTWTDAKLTDALHTALQMGLVSDHAVGDDGESVTPGIVAPTGDPNAFALLMLQAAKMLMFPQSPAVSLRTRAMTFRRGSLRELLVDWDSRIEDLQSGEAFAGWDALRSCAGVLMEGA